MNKKSKSVNPLIPFENMWVALTVDRKRVVASGETIKELEKKMDKIDNREVIFTKVLPFDQFYSPQGEICLQLSF